MVQSSELLGGWQTILPKCVTVVAGPMQAPSPSFRSPITVLGEERKTELNTGEIYARRALALLDVDYGELKRRSSGAIEWPAGIVGSLTHMRSTSVNHCAVTVARQSDIRALGIDAEQVVPLDPHVWLTFITTAEISELMTWTAPERNKEVIKLWSIKEAVIKALPCVCEPWRIETHYDRDEESWSVKVLDPTLTAHNWDIRTTLIGDIVLTAAIVL